MDAELVLSVNEKLEATLPKQPRIVNWDVQETFDSFKRASCPFEMELNSMDSQITYYSLCYMRFNDSPTRYYAAHMTFRIPPSEFLGEEEKLMRPVVHWT